MDYIELGVLVTTVIGMGAASWKGMRDSVSEVRESTRDLITSVENRVTNLLEENRKESETGRSRIFELIERNAKEIRETYVPRRELDARIEGVNRETAKIESDVREVRSIIGRRHLDQAERAS